MRKNGAVYGFDKEILFTEYFMCVIHNFLQYRKFAVIISLLIMSLIPLTAYADTTVNVTLKNGLNNLPLADKQVTAYERNSSGELSWVQRKFTDNNGNVEFDLEGIDNGSIYVLKARPYNTGSVYSKDVTVPGNFDFLVGKVELTMINGATGLPLQDTKVYARRILGNNKTESYKWGASDSEAEAFLC